MLSLQEPCLGFRRIQGVMGSRRQLVGSHLKTLVQFAGVISPNVSGIKGHGLRRRGGADGVAVLS